MKWKKDKRLKNSLLSWTDYFGFFFLIAGSITACFFLFFRFANYTDLDIDLSVIVTFGNVLFITFLSTFIYGIWRHFNISIPVSRILEGTDRIKEGELGVEIQRVHKNEQRSNEFDIIIDNLNTMSKDLRGIETLRTDFISNVSHELKAPLATIQNYSTLLQSDDLTSAERQEYARNIIDSSKHLSELITNILKLNKLENQEIFPEKKKYDVSEQLVQCILSFENIWESKNIDLRTDIEENILIEADEELMSIVWNNLLSNAAKFTPDEGIVWVSIKRESNEVKVIVEDSGIGMDEDTVQHIFEKFYQGDTSHSVKGNGLGLALAKRILDIENMDIKVQSVPGQGSRFTVICPSIN